VGPGQSARANLRKHGVSFASAALSLLHERALVRTDPDSNGEARYVAISADPLGQTLVTVFTFRGARVRIISSRRATQSERRTFEQG
jgi:uncharacterized DUF497 family protein